MKRRTLEEMRQGYNELNLTTLYKKVLQEQASIGDFWSDEINHSCGGPETRYTIRLNSCGTMNIYLVG